MILGTDIYFNMAGGKFFQKTLLYGMQNSYGGHVKMLSMYRGDGIYTVLWTRGFNFHLSVLKNYRQYFKKISIIILSISPVT